MLCLASISKKNKKLSYLSDYLDRNFSANNVNAEEVRPGSCLYGLLLNSTSIFQSHHHIAKCKFQFSGNYGITLEPEYLGYTITILSYTCTSWHLVIFLISLQIHAL